MKSHLIRRTLAASVSILLLLAFGGELLAQSKSRIMRQRDNGNRSTTDTTTPPPATREPAPIPTTPATPVATPVAEPVAIERPAEPAAVPKPKPAASSPSIPGLGNLDSLTERLPENVQTVISDTRVQSAVEMVTEKAKDSDELLKKAQENYQAVKDQGGVPSSLSEAKAQASSLMSGGSPDVPAEAESIPVAAAVAATPIQAAPEPAPILATAATNGDVPAPRPMQARYQRDTADAPMTGSQSADTEDDGENMKIKANETEMREKDGVIIFKGDVFVVQPGFTLYCDQLNVYQYTEGESPDHEAGEMKNAIATGRIVEIKRLSETGQAQVAQSRRADIDPISGTVVLTGGPPVMQSGGHLVKTQSADAKIILTKDKGHQIIDRGTPGGSNNNSGSTIIVPLPKGKGSTKEPALPGGSGGLEGLRSGN